MSSVIIAGATGAVGRELVVQCVKEPRIRRVVALSRRAAAAAELPLWFPLIDECLAPSKLTVVQVDWEQLTSDTLPAHLTEAFSGHEYGAMCMGTTRGEAGSAKRFERCDLTYVLAFGAHVRRQNPQLRLYSQVSSEGAASSSFFLYLATKGRADDGAVALGFPALSIWRPGLLGRKEKARLAERLFSLVAAPLDVALVGKAMCVDFFRADGGTQIYGNGAILRLAQTGETAAQGP